MQSSEIKVEKRSSDPIFGQVSLLIPTYLESQALPDFLSALMKVLGSLPWKSEVIVVDDNSPDGTAGLATAFASKSIVSVSGIVRRARRKDSELPEIPNSFGPQKAGKGRLGISQILRLLQRFAELFFRGFFFIRTARVTQARAFAGKEEV